MLLERAGGGSRPWAGMVGCIAEGTKSVGLSRARLRCCVVWRSRVARASTVDGLWGGSIYCRGGGGWGMQSWKMWGWWGMLDWRWRIG